MKGFDRAALAQVLDDGILEMGMNVAPEQRTQLMDYLALMAKWNSVYNLTSLRDPMQMVTHHLLDSLAAVPAFFDARKAGSRARVRPASPCRCTRRPALGRRAL